MQDDRNQEKKLWFRAKYYGWGWYPVTWQGWFSILIYLLLIIPIINNFANLKEEPSANQIILKLILPTAILTTILIAVCYKTGEKPRWQWGKGPKNN